MRRITSLALAAALIATATAGAEEGRGRATVLLFDTSAGAAGGPEEQARELARGYLAARAPGDASAVLSVQESAQLVAPLGSRRETVEAAVADLSPGSGGAALYDALWDASQHLAASPHPARAILLFSPGRDTASAVLFEDAVRSATANHVLVFPIASGRQVDEHGLRRLAKLTGGRYFPAAELEHPAAILAAIDEIFGRVAPVAASGPEAAAQRAVPLETASRGPSRWLVGGGAAALLALLAVGLRRRRSPPALETEPDVVTTPDLAGEELAAFPERSPALETEPGFRPELEPLPGTALETEPGFGPELEPLPGTAPEAGPVLEPEPVLAMEPASALPPPVAAGVEDAADGELDPLSRTVSLTTDQVAAGLAGEADLHATVILAQRGFLCVERGAEAGRRFPLEPEGDTGIGRAPDNQVQIDDESVSSHHLRVRIEGSLVTVADLGSTNGSFLNERRLESEAPLAPGDILRLGESELVYRIEQLRE